MLDRAAAGAAMLMRLHRAPIAAVQNGGSRRDARGLTGPFCGDVHQRTHCRRRVLLGQFGQRAALFQRALIEASGLSPAPALPRL